MTDENRTDDERDLAASLVSAPEPDAIHSDGAEFDASTESGTDTTVAEPEEAPQYGVGPFTIREVAILGLWAVGFIVSFFSVVQIPFRSVWMSGIDWVLPIGVPTVAVATCVDDLRDDVAPDEPS